jgi:membrane protease YdiL (CAAX protease family)
MMFPEKPFHRALFYFLSFATAGIGFLLPTLPASLVSTGLLLLFAKVLFGLGMIESLGIHLSRRSLGLFAVSFLVALVFALLVIRAAVSHAAIFVIQPANVLWLLLFTVFFQSFCEEVLFRTYLIRDILPKLTASRALQIFISGCFFSFAHWLNYRLSEAVNLSPMPLLTLFFLGASGTVLFLGHKNIMAAWGFHMGWNATRFAFVLMTGGKPAAESVTFENIEGHPLCLLLGISLFLFLLHPPEAAKAILYASTQKTEPVSPSDISPPRK